jgi:aubergine-like protein
MRDITVTRPSFIQSKKGTSGKQVLIEANYFKLAKTPDWTIHNYYVEFTPDVESKTARKTMLFGHRDTLGGYMFDGQTLFLTKKLPQPVTQLQSVLPTGESVQIQIKYISIIPMTQSTSIQILNLVLRRAMETMQLQSVGRHFFDAAARIDVLDHKLQLWPGYYTSIRQHENDILVCVEIAHKIMRNETVYDVMNYCIKSSSTDFQQSFRRAVVGLTVLTDYNNRTYKINDVDFNSNPMTEFETKQGKDSYQEYYYKVLHNLTLYYFGFSL